MVSFCYILFKSVSYCLLKLFCKDIFFSQKFFFSHVNFTNKNFYLTKFPMVMDQFSAAEIFNTSVRDLPKPRLIQTRRNLLALLNGDAFYPLSTWPQDIQQIFWKKPIGDTDKFQLMMFFLDNGCLKHLITDWILTSQHVFFFLPKIGGCRGPQTLPLDPSLRKDKFTAATLVALKTRLCLCKVM